jgi:hypothetical protein
MILKYEPKGNRTMEGPLKISVTGLSKPNFEIYDE